MSKSLVELHVERGRLLERIASQRAALSVQLEPVQAAGDAAARALEGLRRAGAWMQANPLPAAGVLMLLVLARPRGAWRWARRSLALWRTWQALRASTPWKLWRAWRRSVSA